MKIASRATPEGLAGHGLSTTDLYDNQTWECSAHNATMKNVVPASTAMSALFHCQDSGMLASGRSR